MIEQSDAKLFDELDAFAHLIGSEGELDALYGPPSPASITKEVSSLNTQYRALIEASPFAMIGSVGVDGLDVSPRGDAPGFVSVLDDRTLAIPDRRGNNRLDTLRNVLRDPRMALLFLIPGYNETLRVNGRGRISIAPRLLERFTVNGRAPATVLLVSIDAVYFQCGKAVVRSGLWNADRHVDRRALPSAGDMLRATTEGFDGAAYDAALPDRQRQTLY